MMPSPPIDDRNDTRHSCWLAAGSAQARIACAGFDQQSRDQSRRATRRSLVHTDAHAHRLAANRSPQPLRSSLIKPEPAAKSP